MQISLTEKNRSDVYESNLLGKPVNIEFECFFPPNCASFSHSTTSQNIIMVWLEELNDLLMEYAFIHVKHPEWETRRLRRFVPEAAWRRTWSRGEPPAHTDTAPEPEHTHMNTHRYMESSETLLPNIYSGQYILFNLCALTSLVFLMICCKRMRKFSGSLFTISSRLQRFIDWPAEHISTEKQQM